MRRIFPALACLALISCVSWQGLPAAWDDHETHNTRDDCQSIAGTYKNRGEYPDGSPAWLSSLLIPAADRKNAALDTTLLEKAETVSLEKAPNASFLMRMTGDGFERKKLIDRQKGHYRCVDGVMHIDDTHGEQNGVLVRSSLAMRYVYRSDNWLYVKSSGFSTTMLLVLPLNAWEYRWARFPVLQDEAARPGEAVPADTAIR